MRSYNIGKAIFTFTSALVVALLHFQVANLVVALPCNGQSEFNGQNLAVFGKVGLRFSQS
jgi:hypothetical protein